MLDVFQVTNKIFAHLVNDQLRSYLQSTNPLSNNQKDFCKKNAHVRLLFYTLQRHYSRSKAANTPWPTILYPSSLHFLMAVNNTLNTAMSTQIRYT